MTRLAQAAALVLSTLATVVTVAGANGLAGTQYAVAQRLAQAGAPVVAQEVAVQRVVIVGHRNA